MTKRQNKRCFTKNKVARVYRNNKGLNKIGTFGCNM